MEFDLNINVNLTLTCPSPAIRSQGLTIINNHLRRTNEQNIELQYAASIYFDMYMSLSKIPPGHLSTYEVNLLASSCTYIAIRTSNKPQLLNAFLGSNLLASSFAHTYPVFNEPAKLDIQNRMRGKALELLVLMNFEVIPVTPLSFVEQVYGILQVPNINRRMVTSFLHYIQVVPHFTNIMEYPHIVKAACAVLAVISFTQDFNPFRATLGNHANFDEDQLNQCIVDTQDAKTRIGRHNSFMEDLAIRRVNGARLPPQARMDIIYQLGGLNIKLICDRNLTARETIRNELRLTTGGQELDHELSVEEKAACTAAGLQVSTIEPNNNIREMHLHQTPNSFYVLKPWLVVLHDATNNLAHNTRIKVFSFRVSGNLNFIIDRV